MGYSNQVDICFSISGISKLRSDADYLSESAGSLCAEVDALARSAMQYISDTLEYIKRCLEVNYTDGENAEKFRRWLENSIWKTEKELEAHERRCNELYKLKQSAANDYERIRSNSKSGDKASERALEAAARALRDAEDALKGAYAERDDCKRRIDCLKQAQNDLYWIEDKIHKDYIMLSDNESEFNRLANDLHSVYERFGKQSEIGMSKISDAIECAKAAERYAKAARYHIGQMIGSDPSDDSETKISSISAVYRAGDNMESLNRSARSRESYLKRASEEYNELVIDNIMSSADELIAEILESISVQIRLNEKKAQSTKDLAQSLQCYYDTV